MLTVVINGQPQTLASVISVATLLDHFGYEQPFVAVAINRKFVGRSEFQATPVHDGDDIEILAPMSGG